MSPSAAFQLKKCRADWKQCSVLHRGSITQNSHILQISSSQSLRILSSTCLCSTHPEFQSNEAENVRLRNISRLQRMSNAEFRPLLATIGSPMVILQLDQSHVHFLELAARWSMKSNPFHLCSCTLLLLDWKYLSHLVKIATCEVALTKANTRMSDLVRCSYVVTLYQ